MQLNPLSLSPNLFIKVGPSLLYILSEINKMTAFWLSSPPDYVVNLLM